MKTVIGWVLMFLPPAALFTYIVLHDGWKFFFLFLGFLSIVVGIILLGAWLINS